MPDPGRAGCTAAAAAPRHDLAPEPRAAVHEPGRIALDLHVLIIVLVVPLTLVCAGIHLILPSAP